MASIISAGTTSGTSLNLSGDTSGILQLASNGSTTAVTIDTNQRAAFVAGTAALPAITTTGDTNTGIYFPAADTVATSTGGTERMRIASDGTISTTIGSTLYGAYPSRAWVNFNGQGTVAIRTSRNVSSITDNGTGDYTVNFTTSMPDNEYCVTATSTFQAGVTNAGGVVATRNTGNTTPDQTASGVRVITIGVDNTAEADSCQVNVSIFR
jgi:hypothetical protein